MHRLPSATLLFRDAGATNQWQVPAARSEATTATKGTGKLLHSDCRVHCQTQSCRRRGRCRGWDDDCPTDEPGLRHKARWSSQRSQNSAARFPPCPGKQNYRENRAQETANDTTTKTGSSAALRASHSTKPSSQEEDDEEKKRTEKYPPSYAVNCASSCSSFMI